MKYLTSIISVLLIFNLSLISPNVISRNEVKLRLINERIGKLNIQDALNILSQRPTGGNDDPTVNTC